MVRSDGDVVIDYVSHTGRWPTDPRTWERYACQVAGRDLTPRSGATCSPIVHTATSALSRPGRPPTLAQVDLISVLQPVETSDGTASAADASAMEVYGQPGAVLFGSEDRPLAVVTVDVADDLVQTVRAVTNPVKLGHLHAFTGPREPGSWTSPPHRGSSSRASRTSPRCGCPSQRLSGRRPMSFEIITGRT
jgi:hypothetical protein